MKDPWIKVGFIANSHGLRGEAKVESLSDVPDRWNPGTRLYVGEFKTPVTVEESRPWKHMFLVRFQGKETAEQIDEWKGQYLFVRDADRPVLSEDTWYLDDLIGLIAVDVNTDRAYGTVVDVLETLANAVLVIRTQEGNEELVPFVKERTGAIDGAEKTIRIDRWEEA